MHSWLIWGEGDAVVAENGTVTCWAGSALTCTVVLVDAYSNRLVYLDDELTGTGEDSAGDRRGSESSGIIGSIASAVHGTGICDDFIIRLVCERVDTEAKDAFSAADTVFSMSSVQSCMSKSRSSESHSSESHSYESHSSESHSSKSRSSESHSSESRSSESHSSESRSSESHSSKSRSSESHSSESKQPVQSVGSR